jgi:membrane-associated protein
VIDFFLNYGAWTYGVLFLVIFAETGFVITPFLPGDSLLFAVGALCAIGGLKIFWAFIILCAAAILGDTVNYWLGHFIGPKIKFINKKYLDQTQIFYDKHGGKTIILARFVPVIRTFAPFVAGIGKMNYRKFLSYNIVGGISWIALFLFAGYFFGNIQFVKNNFETVIIAIIFISIIPGIIAYLRNKKPLGS